MSVNSATFVKSVTISSEDGNKIAIATKWKVNFKSTSTLSFSSTKTYHVVILNEQKREGLFGRSSTNMSAYVTNTIPKKSDLSKSTLHLEADSDNEVLNDHLKNPICSFKKTDLVDLGFTIDKAEFEKVDSISPEIIKNIGDFLKTYLETTSSSSSSSSSSKPEEKKAETKTEEKEKPVDDESKDKTKPLDSSKGWTRPSLSNLCARATPLVAGFVFSATALAISHFVSSEGNIV
ncbi:MAG: hypothetical protein K1060chlam3_00041 [Candidatus Anoxychlamydiales bacterium]|nr:hypothetical protein [Candidatus Anoxychlamydiales bacterium]